MHATVVVCTRNRADLLRVTLAAALAQDLAAPWQLVVVDNASTDSTRDVAEDAARAAPDRVRVVQEPRLGLSAARNRGLVEAQGAVVAFLDDDAVPRPGWLAALVGGLAEDGVAAVGGPVAPVFGGPLPPWFLGRFLPYLTVWDRGPEPHDLHYNEYPRGANMAFDRRALGAVGGFSHHLGRTGRSLLSCEEVELCLRLERTGQRVRYLPGAAVDHHVAVNRITPEWMLARFTAQGRSEAVIDWRHGGLPGLRAGLAGQRRAARAAARSEGRASLAARCHRRAVAGYRAGALTAPWRVPRWRDGAPWRPPALS